MHSVSSTLATLVLREAAKARLSEPIRGCPKEFEDSVYRELAELHRTRPRLVAFAPTEALKRVLAFLDVRRCLGSHAERQPVPSRLTVIARGMATKIALSALAATLIAGAAVPAIAGVSHRERQVGHHAQQHEHEVSVAGKRKGNKSKTLKRAFFSDGKIAIPALGSTSGSGPADPYPSTLAVAGFKKAKVTDVNLTLRALSHAFAPDVTVQLVAPGGRSAVVMGNVGTAAGSRAVSNITLTLDDEAIAVLPATDQLTNGSFRPRDNSGLPSLPAPAPALSGNQALATFDGINPNGQWQLFVFDKGGGDTGSLADGWTLEITAKSKVKNTGNGKKKR